MLRLSIIGLLFSESRRSHTARNARLRFVEVATPPLGTVRRGGPGEPLLPAPLARQPGGAPSLLHEPGAQSCKFGIADRSCLFQPVQFFDFVCGAETNHAPEFVARLISLLDITFRHASSEANFGTMRLSVDSASRCPGLPGHEL